MNEYDLDTDFRRIRTAIDKLQPSKRLSARLERIVAQARSEQSLWSTIAYRSRMVTSGALAIIAMALLIGWRMEVHFTHALARGSLAMLEMLP